MWEQSLVVVSLVSALISLALGIAFCFTLNRLGTIEADASPPRTKPTITTIMPARNEQLDLESAVRSILAQQNVQLQIIIVNDHSSDRTGEIADSIASGDDRVRVIHDPLLRDGWLGKANAMQTAFIEASGEFVVFVDADVVHHPNGFSTAVSVLENKQIEMLSLCPTFECESFWENVLLPHCFIAGTLQFCVQSVNNPKSPNGAAAGAFMLLRRETLTDMGGLETIRSEFLDDVALAKSVKRHDGDARFYFAPKLLRVRLFKNNHDAFWGLTKNILGAVDNIIMAVPAMLLPIFVYWVPIACLTFGLWDFRPAMIGAGGAALVIQVALLVPVSRLCRIRWCKAVLFPLAAFPVFCCFSRALYHRLGSGTVIWRGRKLAIR